MVDAAKSIISTHTPTSKILRGTTDPDTINNVYDADLTIHGSDGNNSNSSINGGEDDDSVTVYGERGYNTIENCRSNVSIYGALTNIRLTSQGLELYGRAVVNNYGDTVTIMSIIARTETPSAFQAAQEMTPSATSAPTSQSQAAKAPMVRKMN